jgi:hypothetical protein
MFALGLEVAACDHLFKIAPVAWHAVFDVIFWQGVWSLVGGGHFGVVIRRHLSPAY